LKTKTKKIRVIEPIALLMPFMIALQEVGKRTSTRRPGRV